MYISLYVCHLLFRSPNSQDNKALLVSQPHFQYTFPQNGYLLDIVHQ